MNNDNVLFLWHDAIGILMDILAMHIDDFVFCGNDLFQKNVIVELKKIFRFGIHESGTFKFLGLGVKQNKRGNYYPPKSVCFIYIPNRYKERKVFEKWCGQEEKTESKRLTDQIMWLSTQTWLDVAFDMCQLSTTGKFPKVKLLFESNKEQQKLKSRTGSITFPQLRRPLDLNIVCHADATYASLEDGSSQGGFIIYFFGMTNKMALIYCSSKKLTK